jgi:hypothetical protein
MMVLARSLLVTFRHSAYETVQKKINQKEFMKGIYREILQPGHVVKVIKRDADGISYEDGGKIICTKRIDSFDRRFKKDDSATLADLVSDYSVAIAK